MNIKKTALYQLHKEHNAKFVEFAGYSMPIQYSEGIVKEHNITRSKSGIFDVSHMGQLFIKYSNDITSKLQEILPTDLKNLKINQSKYSFLMKENGGIYDDLIITRMKDQYMIILNAACKENDLQIIRNKLNDQSLEINNNFSLVAIQGPESKSILESVISNVSKLKFMNGENFSFENNEIYITRSGYTGEDGFEISLPNKVVNSFVGKLISKGSTLIGLGARDTLRLEAGLCLYGHDINENTSPVEANLKWAISKERISKGDFIGSDIIIKQLNDGVSKIRVGIKPEGRIIAREKTKIFNESDIHIGEITSGTFGPSVNGPVAMGYVENEFSKKDTKIFLEVRGKKHPANICSLPFYKKSYVKGSN